jgi:hypothetical protein
MRQVMSNAVSAALLLSVPVALASAPAGAQVQGRGTFVAGGTGIACTVYEDINLGGASREIRPGAAMTFVGAQWNDRISSIACEPGCTLMAYEHADYQGARQVFADVVNYVGDGWNDRISSLDTICS